MNMYENCYFATDCDALPRETDYIKFDDEKTYPANDVPAEAFEPQLVPRPGVPRLIRISGHWPSDGTEPCFGVDAILKTIRELKARDATGV